MDLEEVRAHSFILKLWIEEPDEPGRPAVWRGRITHVPSGGYRYVRDLGAVVDFLAPYLYDLGVRSLVGRGARRWRMPWQR